MTVEVPFYKPFLPDYKVVEAEIQDAYNRGHLAPGMYTERLCSAVADYLGVKHCVAFSCCSDAMMCLAGYYTNRLPYPLSQKGALVPDFTFAATWQAADWNEQKTILCEVTSEGLIDLDKLELLIKENYKDEPYFTCAIPVHMFGNPVDEDRLRAILGSTPIFYDAAHGFGTMVYGKPLGCSGNTHVFSIGTTKPLAAGEGGLVTTNDSELAEAMFMAAMHGHNIGELDVKVKSLNGRIQEFNSILAYHGLKMLPENIEKRTAAAEYYDEHFPMCVSSDFIEFTLTPIITRRPHIQPSYKDYTIILNAYVGGKPLPILPFRDFLCKYLEARSIPIKKYYYPTLSRLSYYDNTEHFGRMSDYWLDGTSVRLSESCISIPFFTEITQEQMDRVVDVLYSGLSSLLVNSYT